MSWFGEELSASPGILLEMQILGPRIRDSGGSLAICVLAGLPGNSVTNHYLRSPGLGNLNDLSYGEGGGIGDGGKLKRSRVYVWLNVSMRVKNCMSGGTQRSHEDR